jgi:hypothetical protein
MAQRIYFDESGFTGNNLLDPEQRLFAYASVATDRQEAKYVVEDLIRRYQIQGGELKGGRLVKSRNGRKAIDEILDYFGKRLKISISDKRYALACKFHEYIFEPCYSTINSLFYRIGFHRFIANMLYVEFGARSAPAEEIFRKFEELMRTKDEAYLESIFLNSDHPAVSPIVADICEFARYRADDIRAELAALGGQGEGKWILDLSKTALFTLLANWGVEYNRITAVCDASKPLGEDQAIFNAMIDRQEQVFSDLFGCRRPITFNLTGPIKFADSSLTHGVQIADAVAAAAVYVFSGATDVHAMKWRMILPPISPYASVVPDFDEVNPHDIKVQRNALVLSELHSRAKEGRSLVEGMVEFIQVASTKLVTDPILP